jgi:predicted PurR-regulated permease PerM
MEYTRIKKANSILIFTFSILLILYFGSEFLVPFTLAMFLAALVTPISSHLEKMGLNRVLSSFISTFLIFLVTGSILLFLVSQLSALFSDLPLIQSSVHGFIIDLQEFIAHHIPLTPEEQLNLIRQRSDDLLYQAQQRLGVFLGNTFRFILQFLIVTIYVFLLLHSRRKLQNFFVMYTKKDNEEKAKVILNKTAKVAQRYIWGRLKVMTLLGIMYIITFTIFGLPYALLLTIFGAVITIIPYVGPFVSGIVPIAFSILFGWETSTIIIFSIIILIIQLIESYVLEPIILGSEVQLSPLAVVIAIILGNMFWGIVGMILFVPIFAIIKIIADNTSGMRPIGYLIGYSGKDPGEKFWKNLRKDTPE